MSSPTLNATDRCDRCGSQAFVMVEKMYETPLEIVVSDLLFCGHHFNKHSDALFFDHWTLTVDLRDTLNPKPSLSASNA